MVQAAAGAHVFSPPDKDAEQLYAPPLLQPARFRPDAAATPCTCFPPQLVSSILCTIAAHLIQCLSSVSGHLHAATTHFRHSAFCEENTEGNHSVCITTATMPTNESAIRNASAYRCILDFMSYLLSEIQRTIFSAVGHCFCLTGQRVAANWKSNREQL